MVKVAVTLISSPKKEKKRDWVNDQLMNGHWFTRKLHQMIYTMVRLKWYVALHIDFSLRLLGVTFVLKTKLHSAHEKKKREKEMCHQTASHLSERKMQVNQAGRKKYQIQGHEKPFSALHVCSLCYWHADQVDSTRVLFFPLSFFFRLSLYHSVSLMSCVSPR